MLISYQREQYYIVPHDLCFHTNIHIEGSFGSAITFAATDELIEAIKNGDLDAIGNINFETKN